MERGRLDKRGSLGLGLPERFKKLIRKNRSASPPASLPVVESLETPGRPRTGSVGSEPKTRAMPSKTAIVLPKGSVPVDRQKDAIFLLSGSPDHRPRLGSVSSRSCSGDGSDFDDLENDSKMAAFVFDRPSLAYRTLLQAHSCYDAVPTHSKILALDIGLPVKKAFHAFIYNRARAALLWNHETNSLAGMLTITDFIRILLHCVKDSESGLTIEKQLESHEIRDWRRLLEDECWTDPLFHVKADQSLYHAASVLARQRVHRIPVIDPVTGNPIYILTYKRLLKFMWIFGRNLPKPLGFHKTPKELGVGVWGANLHKAYPDMLLLHCLEALLACRVSGLPIVSRPVGGDRGDQMLDLYSRFDAISIATSACFEKLRSITVQDALDERKGSSAFTGVVRCTVTLSLSAVMERLVEAEVERMLIVDAEDRLVGVVGISDIMRHFVLHPPSDRNQKDRICRKISEEPGQFLDFEMAELVPPAVIHESESGSSV